MTISNREISFYVDTLIVEAIIGNEKLYKKASAGGLVMSLIDKVKSYVSNHINPDDKVGSLMNILGPGVIFTAFRAFGFSWLGLLVSLAMQVFHIDVAGFVKSVWDKLKGLISGDKQITSAQVDSVVQSAAQDHMKPATQEEADAAEKLLNKSSFDDLMRDVRMVKLTMVAYHSGIITKEAGFLDLFNSRKLKTTSILSRVIGWVLKIGLASAGLLVAGDVVNKFIGRPNALDSSLKDGKPTDGVSSSFFGSPPKNEVSVMPSTTQTKFKANPFYKIENFNVTNNWSVSSSNNESAISDLIVKFAKEVYSGLDGRESIIRSTAGFQAVVDRIVFFNRKLTSGSMIFIPPEFHSKKQMVDYFIDDVAEKAK